MLSKFTSTVTTATTGPSTSSRNHVERFLLETEIADATTIPSLRDQRLLKFSLCRLEPERTSLGVILVANIRTYKAERRPCNSLRLLLWSTNPVLLLPRNEKEATHPVVDTSPCKFHAVYWRWLCGILFEVNHLRIPRPPHSTSFGTCELVILDWVYHRRWISRQRYTGSIHHPLTRSHAVNSYHLLLQAALQPRPYTWIPLLSQYVVFIPRATTFGAAWHFFCVKLRRLFTFWYWVLSAG